MIIFNQHFEMQRDYYLNLAKEHKRMIFGVDLILKEKKNHNEIVLNGDKLGEVVIEATKRFNMQMALPWMDLDVEKQELLELLGLDLAALDGFHFDETNISEETRALIKKSGHSSLSKRLEANCQSIRYVKENSNYLPVGMCIGPFSFITKLLRDPIFPVFLYSMGVTGTEDPSVCTLELAFEAATEVILKSIRRQIEAGAKAICVCEPAANNVYISPDILVEDGEDVFDKLVLKYNYRITELLGKNDVDLILHDCGELTDLMVKKLCKLHPVILSLGSSRNLWKDARIIPGDIVLFGNLPTKQFLMDDEMTNEKVVELTNELEAKMKKSGHPFILGSECDVLSVEGYQSKIMEKVNLMLTCKCHDHL